MLEFNSENKIDIDDSHEISEFFHWLPHKNEIIVIKKVFAISKIWGRVEIDRRKIKETQIFGDSEVFPSDYAVEVLAQSIGMIGAAQSKLGLVSRGTSAEAYVTGLKDFNFVGESIDLKSPLFVEIYETRALESFRFCNVKLYRQVTQEDEEEVLVSGVMKTFTIESETA